LADGGGGGGGNEELKEYPGRGKNFAMGGETPLRRGQDGEGVLPDPDRDEQPCKRESERESQGSESTKTFQKLQLCRYHGGQIEKREARRKRSNGQEQTKKKVHQKRIPPVTVSVGGGSWKKKGKSKRKKIIRKGTRQTVVNGCPVGGDLSCDRQPTRGGSKEKGVEKTYQKGEKTSNLLGGKKLIKSTPP